MPDAASLDDCHEQPTAECMYGRRQMHLAMDDHVALYAYIHAPRVSPVAYVQSYVAQAIYADELLSAVGRNGSAVYAFAEVATVQS